MGRLGGYRVLKVLGEGGMGVIFLAEDTTLNRRIALKVIRPAIARSEESRLRFLNEARATAAIEHEHIVAIYQVGEDRGVPFLAMPLLQGETLEVRLLRDGTLPIREAVRLAREIAEGLAAAHEKGLIHRDIKPSNIWLLQTGGAPQRVKILDFGMARSLESEKRKLTRIGTIVGTPGYMAPEQAHGKPVDGRCDLFSLGCVLYRMLTGKRPFKGATPLNQLLSLDRDEPIPPDQLDARIPAKLSEFVMRLLSKTTENRPPTAIQVVLALQEIENQLANHVGQTTPVIVAVPSLTDVPTTTYAAAQEPTPVTQKPVTLRQDGAPSHNRRRTLALLALPVAALAALILGLGMLVGGYFLARILAAPTTQSPPPSGESQAQQTIPPIPPPPSSEYDQRMAAAQRQVEAKQYIMAIGDYKAVLLLFPEDPLAKDGLARYARPAISITFPVLDGVIPRLHG